MVYLKWEEFYRTVLHVPGLHMIDGTIGVGKTTLAISLVREVLDRSNKVFYLLSKQSHHNKLFQRLLSDSLILAHDSYEGHSEENPFFSSSNFLLWAPKSIAEQEHILFGWLQQIQQLHSFFHSKKVGLLVIDELTSHYLLEMGTEDTNALLNDALAFQLATLTELAQKYQIPVLILNSLSLKRDEQENIVENPVGGKVVDYWVDTEIRLYRTPLINQLQFDLKKNRLSLTLPKTWLWIRGEKGFHSVAK